MGISSLEDVRKFEQPLRCELTDGEVAHHASEAAEKRQQWKRHTLRAKEAAKSAKIEIEGLDREISIHLQRVRDRWEYRDVPCEEWYDREAREVVIIRTDTGVATDSRPVTDEERQGRIPVATGPPAPDQDAIDRKPAGS